MRLSYWNILIRMCVFAAVICAPHVGNTPAAASCGSASCFLTIGNQPSVQPKDLIRVDLNYTYIPQNGPTGQVAAVDVESRTQVLNEHLEFQTINQRVQLDVNYGITDNLTLQLTLPIISREHDHRIEAGEGTAPAVGEFENFDTTGLGDMRLMAKYGFLPTLRSLIVVGLGVDFPTGNFEARNINGRIQEPSLQVGRGDWGIAVHAFQSYELIPHKVNQFVSYTYNRTFQNKFAYQFGDTHLINGGVNWLVTPRITLSAQLNYRYTMQDQCVCSLRAHGFISQPGEATLDPNKTKRGVANTGSTSLFFTPGVTLRLGENTSWYFYGSAPLVRDFRGALEPGVTWLTGFVHFFSFQGDNA